MADRKRTALELAFSNAAGIDIGSASHFIPVPPDRNDEPVREFKSFTVDLEQAAYWLVRCGMNKEFHLICDNYATHKHLKVKEWLDKHPRLHIHFTPTSASWLDMVERFFRSIATDRLERGVFRSVQELINAIEECIAAHNQNPKPFVWTAKANDILQKVIHANHHLGSKKNEALH